MTVEIEIGKLGTHTDAHGISKGFTRDFFDEVVNSYDPGKFIAPAIISHDTQGVDDIAIASSSELSYGATQSLKVEGDRLKAVFDRVSPKLVQHFKNGELLAVSPSFYPPGHKNNPSPGKWSMRHIAFLGKTPPAIKGLAAPQFSETGFNPEENSLEFSFPIGLVENEDVLNFSIKQEEETQEISREIDNIYKLIEELKESSYQEKPMLEEDNNLEFMTEEEEDYEEEEEEMEEEEKPKKHRKKHKTTDMSESLEFSELQSRIAELEYQVQESDRSLKLQELQLLNSNRQIEAERDNRKRDRIVNFQEELVKSGRLLASQAGDRVLNFGEEEETELTLTDFMMGLDDIQLAFMEDFLTSHPTQIEYGEFATEDKSLASKASSLDFSLAPGVSVTEESVEQYQEILNYCEQHGLDPNSPNDFNKAASTVLN